MSTVRLVLVKNTFFVGRESFCVATNNRHDMYMSMDGLDVEMQQKNKNKTLLCFYYTQYRQLLTIHANLQAEAFTQIYIASTARQQ